MNRQMMLLMIRHLSAPMYARAISISGCRTSYPLIMSDKKRAGIEKPCVCWKQLTVKPVYICGTIYYSLTEI